MYGNSVYPGKWGDVANNTVWKLGYIVEYETNDNFSPTIVAPANITTEAANADGAVVTFEATASDDVGPVTITYTQDPGTVFPLGTTTVTCTATDGAGNAAAAVFTVTVVDTTPPVITTPANITAEATGANGAVVTFPEATAIDAVGPVTLSYSHVSGSNFPLGTTIVNCTATDAYGNKSSGSFIIRVNYDFNGFFKPIDMDGIVNVVKAGSDIPIKFTLGGDMGLDIFAGGYPKSFRVAGFEAGSEFDNIEEIVTTGNSGLSYDPVTGQYTYVWKTDKSWAGTCRQLSVKFADGTEAPLANFKFSK